MRKARVSRKYDVGNAMFTDSVTVNPAFDDDLQISTIKKSQDNANGFTNPLTDEEVVKNIISSAAL